MLFRSSQAHSHVGSRLEAVPSFPGDDSYRVCPQLMHKETFPFPSLSCSVLNCTIDSSVLAERHCGLPSSTSWTPPDTSLRSLQGGGRLRSPVLSTRLMTHNPSLQPHSPQNPTTVILYKHITEKNPTSLL